MDVLLMVQKSSQPPVVYEKPVMEKWDIFSISTADRRISEASTDIRWGNGQKG